MAEEKENKAAATQTAEPIDRIVETEHRVTIGGREIRYSVTTGTLVLREESEKKGEGESEGEKARATVFFA